MTFAYIGVFRTSPKGCIVIFEKSIYFPMTMRPKWNDIRCLRCVACVGSCPTGALSLSGWRIVLNDDKCIGCGLCSRICPVDALRGE